MEPRSAFESEPHSMNRRSFLAAAASALAAGWFTDPARLLAAEVGSAKPVASRRYKIGVCDWMILKRQKLGAFALTKEIGADGVEVDMGSLGDRETFDNQLAKPEVRQQFLDQARALDLEICSLAMSGFYAQSFPERPTVTRMVRDCIDTMKQMRVKVAFLPLGVPGDLVCCFSTTVQVRRPRPESRITEDELTALLQRASRLSANCCSFLAFSMFLGV